MNICQIMFLILNSFIVINFQVVNLEFGILGFAC